MLWLGFAVPDELARTLFAMDPLPAIQTHKFGWSFARTLRSAFGEVTLASSCPVQSFPLVRRILFRSGAFECQGINGVMLGFVNILLFKHITRLVACVLVVAPLIKRQRIGWVFIHGLHTPYLLFGLLARLVGRHVAVVLTDPPGVVLATDSRVVRLLKRLDAWLVGYFLQRVDAVFALAPDLVKRLAPDCPALVFPGILESTLDFPAVSKDLPAGKLSNAEPFTIVYAGGLSQAYGVGLLIDAVLGFAPGVGVRLKLYGRGDQEVRIRQLAAKDARIIYGGFVDAATLMPELCAADILINPRPTSELFSAQSFPSKLIEYLSTGRPVLTTRIASIPTDLKEHFFYIDNESAEGIQMAICALMEFSASDRAKKGKVARQFVQLNYSEAAIGRKIADFVNGLGLKSERNN